MPKTIAALGAFDFSTRPKRRQAVSHIIKLLGQIQNEEFAYLSRIPPNLQGGEAYDAADDSISYLVDAIDALQEAY